MTDRRTGALLGALTVGAFLAASELLSAVVGSGAASALVSWGRLLINVAPRVSVEATIRSLGTSDKTVLTVVMVGIACGIGALAGALSLGTRRGVGIGVVALVLLDVLAAVQVPNASWPSVTIAAGGSGLAALACWRLLSGRLTSPAGPTAQARDQRLVPRRGFLGLAVGLGAVALLGGVAGRWLLSGMAVAAARAGLRLPRPAHPVPPIPDTAQAAIPGISPLITTNDDFYRIDTALLPPSIDPSSWRLRIGGLVNNPHELSFADLLRMPTEEQIITLCCVSNIVGGPLLGTARWLGIPLHAVLEAAHPDPDAVELVARSADGFTASFPLSMALDGRPALVAIGMNGQPLPFEHGFPARLVVGGLYGFTSAVKWLDELELEASSARGEGYWAQRGWTPDAPIRTESRIDAPAADADLASGTVAVAGVAWAPSHGVAVVEIQVDAGPWLRCSLGADLGPWAWRQWSLGWRASAGRHTLSVRATAVGGAVQDPTPSDPFPSGATGLHTIAVHVG